MPRRIAMMFLGAALAGFAPVSLSAQDSAGTADHHAMTAGCRTMANQKEMQEAFADMDARLQELVVEMNASKGQKRVESMAVVLNELVAQRQIMRETMVEMHSPTKMQHTKHGTDEERSSMESMTTCPMMASMTDAQGAPAKGGSEHSKHHP